MVNGSLQGEEVKEAQRGGSCMAGQSRGSWYQVVARKHTEEAALRQDSEGRPGRAGQ